jgi:hypothetical protein
LGIGEDGAHIARDGAVDQGGQQLVTGGEIADVSDHRAIGAACDRPPSSELHGGIDSRDPRCENVGSRGRFVEASVPAVEQLRRRQCQPLLGGSQG